MSKYTKLFECEMRSERDEEHGAYITGRPIVLNAATDMCGLWAEIIDSGALDKTDLRDVRLLVNHDTNQAPLARSRNNNANSTMQLSVDDEGLVIRADLDVENNARASEIYSAISRGDVSGMSFMFTVDGDRWEGLDTDYPTRHITSISKVFEVSAVTFPAYEQTSIEARSAAEALESAKATLESERKAQKEAELRDRIKELLGGIEA